MAAPVPRVIFFSRFWRGVATNVRFNESTNRRYAMTRFRSLTLTAALAGLLAGGVAFAQGPGPGRRGPGGPGGLGGPGGPGGRGGPGVAGLPLRALNLTEAQQDQVKQLTDQYREQSRNLAEQLRTAIEAQ